MEFKFGNSIKTKIVLFAVTMLVVAMGIPTIISFVNTREAIVEAAIKESTQIAAITSKNLKLWVDTRKADVQKLSERTDRKSTRLNSSHYS